MPSAHLNFFQNQLPQTYTRIAIIGGAGGVGAFMTWRLSTVPTNIISLLTTKNSLDAIVNNGLSIKTSEGVFNIPAKRFDYCGTVDDFSNTEQDFVILCTKRSFKDEELAKQIKRFTHQCSVIGIITNGLPFNFLHQLPLKTGHIESVDPIGNISHEFKERILMNIQPIIAAKIISPGLVEVSRPLHAISQVIGILNTIHTSKLISITKLFNEAGVKTSSTTALELRKNILHKWQFALSINTLSALMNKDNGTIFNSVETQPFILYVIILLNIIAQNLGIGPLRNYNQFKLLSITKGHYSSLFHDLEAGKPGEIKAIVNSCIDLVDILQESGMSINIDLTPLRTLIELLEELLEERRTTKKISEAKINVFFTQCFYALDETNACSLIRLQSKL